jgi:hypothetical protein
MNGKSISWNFCPSGPLQEVSSEIYDTFLVSAYSAHISQTILSEFHTSLISSTHNMLKCLLKSYI